MALVECNHVGCREGGFSHIELSTIIHRGYDAIISIQGNYCTKHFHEQLKLVLERIELQP